MMSNDMVKVQVTDGYMAEKITRASPVRAICEMIWNALDADATEIKITFPLSSVGTANDKKIVIQDNGSGIDWGTKTFLFGHLGGSWKKTKIVSDQGRKLHGSEGHGRFKSYALGRYVKWESTYKTLSGNNYSFTINGHKEEPTTFNFEHHIETLNQTGVCLEIDELERQYEWLEDPQKLVDEIAPIFSLYMKNNRDIHLNISGISINPDVYIVRETDILLDDIEYEGKSYNINLKVVEWANQIATQKELWMCSQDGVPLEAYNKQIRRLGDYSFTAYLSSDLFRELNHNNLLSLSGLNSDINKGIDEAIRKLRDFFKKRKIEDHQKLFEKWRQQGIYPYSSDELLDMQSDEAFIQKAEKELFEIVALKVRDNLPNFDDDDTKTKKFQLHMLRQAIESGDTALKRIFKEVLELPINQQEELAELLEESSLSNIIKTSKEVSDRIKFIAALEEIIYDKDIAKYVKERSQLHKILADNTWIFGDEFTLTVNDQSLTKVLAQYLQSKNITDVVVDVPVKRVDQKNGIVDLMLTRSLGNSRPDEVSYLVIELKKPQEHIGQKQYRQVEDYQVAIVNEPRFKTSKSHWDFWIIGDDYANDNFVTTKIKDRASGLVESNHVDGISYSIKAVTWAMLFAQAKHRLEFLKKHLNINASKEDSLQFLKKKYTEYTSFLEESD